MTVFLLELFVNKLNCTDVKTSKNLGHFESQLWKLLVINQQQLTEKQGLYAFTV